MIKNHILINNFYLINKNKNLKKIQNKKNKNRINNKDEFQSFVDNTKIVEANKNSINNDEFPSFVDDSKIFEIKKDKIKSNDLTKLANYWETDKGDKFGCQHNYTQYYQNYFDKINHKKIELFEIGIARGSSLKVWSSYFNNINIDSIDINVNCKNLCKDYDNINLIIADINKINLDKQYDIIIDDGSHLPSDIINSFNKLEKNLKEDGIYIIEDLYADIEYLNFLFEYKKEEYSNNFDLFKEANNHTVLTNFIKKINNEYNIDIYDNKICFIYKNKQLYDINFDT